MTVRPRDWLLILTAAVPLLLGLGLIGWNALSPPPSLDQISRLASQRRFNEAEAGFRAYLRSAPRDDQARLMLAQLCIERPDAKPDLCLEELEQIRSTDAKTRAIVRLTEGKADYKLGLLDEAETAWRDALRLDPLVPEAAWAMLDLYYIESRSDEATHLAVRQSQVEPDPQDRVRLLLELLRKDAMPVDPASIVERFRVLVAKHPTQSHARIALGQALIRNSRVDEGLKLLREVIADHGANADAWEALLQGLEDAHRPDELAQEVSRLPAELAAEPRFLRFRGRAAQDQEHWDEAVKLLKEAWQAAPERYQVGYQLSRALRSAGKTSEAEALETRLRDYEEATKTVRTIYEQVADLPDLGTAPHAELYRRIATLLERLGRNDEARAWHRIVLLDDPRDHTSLEAMRRLGPGAGS